jgi:hypothetical protein
MTIMYLVCEKVVGEADWDGYNVIENGLSLGDAVLCKTMQEAEKKLIERLKIVYSDTPLYFFNPADYKNENLVMEFDPDGDNTIGEFLVWCDSEEEWLNALPELIVIAPITVPTICKKPVAEPPQDTVLLTEVTQTNGTGVVGANKVTF